MRDHGWMRLRWFVGLVVVGAIVAGVVFFLSDDENEPGSARVLPLLGVEGDVPDRSVLAVKIDGTERGRPQTGLAQADVVYEELTEGGLTRLLALYHSEDPETVGPVRSARSTDISLLADLENPLFAWSGANATFEAAVDAAALVDVGLASVPEAYERNSDRQAPYNLYASPEELRAAGADLAAVRAPTPLFSYLGRRETLDGPEVETVRGVTLAGGELTTSIAWDWDQESGTWLRSQDGSPHVDDRDERIGATNVVVRLTEYRDTGLTDSAGSPVPEAVTVGEGDVLVLSDGKAQSGRWHQPTMGAPTTYTDAEGNELRLKPGKTWVEVLPPGTAEPY